jgi:hypothetical protein
MHDTVARLYPTFRTRFDNDCFYREEGVSLVLLMRIPELVFEFA